VARILIIDDEDLIRGMLRQMFERAGYEVVDAPNGKVGMQLYREQVADLIVTDIFMPEQDGLETITELQRDFPCAKIIAISGGCRTADFDGLSLAKGLGALRTLEKPFQHQEMLGTVRELLESEA
jgi:DNA-binding NtrC family response regulator